MEELAKMARRKKVTTQGCIISRSGKDYAVYSEVDIKHPQHNTRRFKVVLCIKHTICISPICPCHNGQHISKKNKK